MVKLPDVFIATKYPGYFFNSQDEKLYSLKIDGELKPLRFHVPNHFNHIGRYYTKLPSGKQVSSKGGFYVSVKGRRKFYPIEVLKELKDHDATIPVRERVTA